MSERDFYVWTRPTRLGAWMGEHGQRCLVRGLQRKYNVKRVLEIGAGKGIIARACRDFGLDYLGIDCSDVSVQRAESEGLCVVYGCVPPLPDLQGFQPDVVVTIDTLSSLPSHNDARRFVAAVAAAVQPGCLFLAIAPDLRFARWFFWDPDVARGFPTTRHRLGRLLYAEGFDIIESRHWLDGFNWPWTYLIYRATKFLPYQLLEGLTSRWSRRNLALYPSMWEMIYRKAPSAYVLGKKQ